MAKEYYGDFNSCQRRLAGIVRGKISENQFLLHPVVEMEYNI